jgi:dTDP-4-amino-4,6-dideoxygalactose transaminase
MTSDLIKVASPQVGEPEVTAVREVLLSGRYVSGPRVAEFERLFADYIGVEHVVAVNSGTAALHAALMAVGVGPGDQVIVPALTFFSTATAVIHQAAVPVFADISLSNFSMAPEDFEQRITSRTKAVIPVHYFGHAVEMDAINAIARRHGIFVIEDCAQAHGTLYRNRKVGSIGDLGAFSFFATKHLTTGEGGAVTTDNAEWAETMRMFRSHGMKGRNDHILLGYNYRMTEMAAALGVVQLGKLDRLNTARIRNSEYLIDRLGDIPWLTLPDVPAHVRHTYFWCHVLIDENVLGFSTQELIARLRERGVEVRNRYLEPLYRQPLLTKHLPDILRLVAGQDLPEYDKMYLPNAERAAGQLIGLPNRPDMTQSDLNQVIEVLHNVQS